MDREVDGWWRSKQRVAVRSEWWDPDCDYLGTYCVLASCGHCNKSLQTNGLKQQRLILSQFWRPGIWNQSGQCHSPSEGGRGRSASSLSQLLVAPSIFGWWHRHSTCCLWGLCLWKMPLEFRIWLTSTIVSPLAKCFLPSPCQQHEGVFLQDSLREAGWAPGGITQQKLFLDSPGVFSSQTCPHCCYCCSVAKSYLTLCDPVDCSMPGCPALHHLSEFAQLHVHWLAMPCNHLILCHPLILLPSIFPSIGKSIGALASASVLPMNIQGWFPLGGTGWISLLSKGLSRVFSNTTVWKHQLSLQQLAL